MYSGKDGYRTFVSFLTDILEENKREKNDYSFGNKVGLIEEIIELIKSKKSNAIETRY